MVSGSADRLVLDQPVVEALRAQLPVVASRAVAAIVAEVPEYADPLRGQLGANITQAVELALGTFLRLVESGADAPVEANLRGALDGAYSLGRGEAQSGRTSDALLAAYRVGARVSWSEWGTVAVAAGLAPHLLVAFAEQVFAFIDQLSAASVAGHGDELAVTGRVREQYREQLARALLGGAPVDELTARAVRADWEPVAHLVAVLVPSSRVRTVVGSLDRRTLVVSPDVLDDHRLPTEISVLVVPLTPAGRQSLPRLLSGERFILGPLAEWTQVRASFERAVRAFRLRELPAGGLDTDSMLGDLVLHADPDALHDLRRRVLAPLTDLPEATTERLAETLLLWLLHQGRREDVAQALTVHPQTVRYRMNQIRACYGDRLSEPAFVRDLVIALGAANSDD